MKLMNCVVVFQTINIPIPPLQTYSYWYSRRLVSYYCFRGPAHGPENNSFAFAGDLHPFLFYSLNGWKLRSASEYNG
ncbi:hypothetical protein I7I48_10807 [Histoplasma ohiense]|nr:hypothetical protein I7I48_10807 [Histoplasma ohiense (nom. inval.)]